MPFDGFMWIPKDAGKSTGAPPVEGETKDEYYGKDNIKAFSIKSFSLDVENPTSIGSAGGGSGVGKAKLNPFKITKFTDNCSPPLFTTCCMGAHYDKAFVAVRKAGAKTSKGQGVEYLLYEFREVFVTQIEWSGDSEDELPTETVTFAYGAMKITYTPQDASGNPLTSKQNEALWNQVLNNGESLEVNA